MAAAVVIHALLWFTSGWLFHPLTPNLSPAVVANLAYTENSNVVVNYLSSLLNPLGLSTVITAPPPPPPLLRPTVIVGPPSKTIKLGPVTTAPLLYTASSNGDGATWPQSWLAFALFSTVFCLSLVYSTNQLHNINQTSAKLFFKTITGLNSEVLWLKQRAARLDDSLIGAFGHIELLNRMNRGLEEQVYPVQQEVHRLNVQLQDPRNRVAIEHDKIAARDKLKNEEIERLKTALSKSQKQSSSHLDGIKQLKKDVAEAREKPTSAHVAQINQLKRSLLESRQESESKAASIEQLKKALEEHRQQSLSSVKAQTATIEQLRKELAESHQLSQSSASNIDSANQELASLKEQSLAHDQEKKSLHKALATSIQRLKESQGSHAEDKKNLTAMQQQLQQSNDYQQKDRKGLEDKAKASEGLLAQAKARINELEPFQQLYEASKASLEDQTELKEENTTLRLDIGQAKEENVKLKQYIRLAKEEIVKLRQNVGPAKEGTSQASSKDQTELTEENTKLRLTISRGTEENAKLRQHIGQANREINKLRENVNPAKEENTKLKQELGEAKLAIDKRDKRVRAVEGDLKKVQPKLKQTEEELEKVKKELEKAKGEIEDFEETIEGYSGPEGLVTVIQDEADTAKVELDKVKLELEAIKTQSGGWQKLYEGHDLVLAVAPLDADCALDAFSSKKSGKKPRRRDRGHGGKRRDGDDDGDDKDEGKGGDGAAGGTGGDDDTRGDEPSGESVGKDGNVETRGDGENQPGTAPEHQNTTYHSSETTPEPKLSGEHPTTFNDDMEDDADEADGEADGVEGEAESGPVVSKTGEGGIRWKRRGKRPQKPPKQIIGTASSFQPGAASFSTQVPQKKKNLTRPRGTAPSHYHHINSTAPANAPIGPKAITLQRARGNANAPDDAPVGPADWRARGMRGH